MRRIRATLVSVIALSLLTMSGSLPTLAQNGFEPESRCQASLGRLEAAVQGGVVTCSRLFPPSIMEQLLEIAIPGVDLTVTREGQLFVDPAADAEPLGSQGGDKAKRVPAFDVRAALLAWVDLETREQVAELRSRYETQFGRWGQFPLGEALLVLLWIDRNPELQSLVAISGNADRNSKNDGQWFWNLRDMGKALDTSYQAGTFGDPPKPQTTSFTRTTRDTGQHIAGDNGVRIGLIKQPLDPLQLEVVSFGPTGRPALDYVDGFFGTGRLSADGSVPLLIGDLSLWLRQAGNKLEGKGELRTPLGPQLDGARLTLEYNLGPNRRGRGMLDMRLRYAGDETVTFKGSTRFPKAEDAVFPDGLSLDGIDWSQVASWFGGQVDLGHAAGDFDRTVLDGQLQRDLDAVGSAHLYPVLLPDKKKWARLESDPPSFEPTAEAHLDAVTAILGAGRGDDAYDPSLDIDGDGFVTLLDAFKYFAQPTEWKPVVDATE